MKPYFIFTVVLLAVIFIVTLACRFCYNAGYNAGEAKSAATLWQRHYDEGWNKGWQDRRKAEQQFIKHSNE
jgi:hypothetical protein